jgi:hypothetical protein
MSRYLYFVFVIVLFSSCAHKIPEIYIRVNNEKYFNGNATLLLDKNKFEIIVHSDIYDQNIGKIHGKIEMLTTPSRHGINYFYSIINDYSGEYSNIDKNCLVLFYENEYGIRVNIHGDESPNMWEGSYEGLYIKSTDIELTENENILLTQIFSEIYDLNNIKELLGYNLKYFLEIFQSYNINKNNDFITIEGWIPGGNQYTNGIVLIKDSKIYILFGDIRKWWDWEYHFYSNDKTIKRYEPNIEKYIPQQIKEWRFFNRAIRILNIVK